MALIDSQAAIDVVHKWLESVFGVSSTDDSIGVFKRLRKLPTIEAEPVIHCKDCKWYGRADKRRFYRGMDCLQKRICTIVPDRDYCSRGERRTDETN